MRAGGWKRCCELNVIKEWTFGSLCPFPLTAKWSNKNHILVQRQNRRKSIVMHPRPGGGFERATRGPSLNVISQQPVYFQGPAHRRQQLWLQTPGQWLGGTELIFGPTQTMANRAGSRWITLNRPRRNHTERFDDLGEHVPLTDKNS